jgi:REP element-mobilizing transposase RayT
MSIWRRFDHGYPALLTTNVEDRRPVFRDPTAARHLFEVIEQIRAEERFDLLAYVIMPDHLHLIARPHADVTTSRIMKMIKGRFARQHQAPTRRRGPFWQSRFHEKALTTDEALWTAVRYVHQNPVQAGIASSPSVYPWSSANSVEAAVRLET